MKWILTSRPAMSRTYHAGILVLCGTLMALISWAAVHSTEPANVAGLVTVVFATHGGAGFIFRHLGGAAFFYDALAYDLARAVREEVIPGVTLHVEHDQCGRRYSLYLGAKPLCAAIPKTAYSWFCLGIILGARGSKCGWRRVGKPEDLRRIPAEGACVPVGEVMDPDPGSREAVPVVPSATVGTRAR